MYGGQARSSAEVLCSLSSADSLGFPFSVRFFFPRKGQYILEGYLLSPKGFWSPEHQGREGGEGGRFQYLGLDRGGGMYFG